MILSAAKLALAAAHRSVVDANRAVTAALAAAAQATTHLLNHPEALRVRRVAAQAHAIRHHLTAALTAIEAALAAHGAITGALHAADPAIHRAAKILEHHARGRVIAHAVDFATFAALFNSDLTLQNCALGCALRRGTSRLRLLHAGFHLRRRTRFLLHCYVGHFFNPCGLRAGRQFRLSRGRLVNRASRIRVGEHCGLKNIAR